MKRMKGVCQKSPPPPPKKKEKFTDLHVFINGPKIKVNASEVYGEGMFSL